MYNIVEVEDDVRVQPPKFELGLQESVKASLTEKWEGLIQKGMGVILVVTSVKSIGEGRIYAGDGAIHYPVQFEMLVYRPEQHEIVEGQVIDVDMSLFGLFPARPYKIVVTKCAGTQHVMTSDETSMGSHLVHMLEVRPSGEGASVLVDRIEVEAGWAAPLVAMWLWLTHHWRHHVRLRLLRRQAGREG